MTRAFLAILVALPGWGQLPEVPLPCGTRAAIMAGWANTTLTANTTYYASFPGASMTTNATVRRIYPGRPGKVKHVEFWVIGTAGSGCGGAQATNNFYIRLNNTADTLIGSDTLATVNIVARVSADVNITMGANDYIEPKITTCTTWTTPAANTYGMIAIWFE